MKYKEIKDTAFRFAEKYLYKWLIKKVFGGAIGGVKGWIVSKLYNYGWKKVIKPFLLSLFRKGEVAHQKKKNEKNLKELNEAKTEQEFDNSVDNLP